MGKPENIALFDLDGTVADWHGALERDLRKHLGSERKKLSKKALGKVGWLIRRQSGWYRNLKILPLGMHIYDLLKSLGFNIMVATKATPDTANAWSEKAAWCAEHLPGAQVTITEDKSKLYGKVLVDDYPKFATPWLEHRPRGVVIMPDQPWNKGFDHPQVFRVKGKRDVNKLGRMLMNVYYR